MRHNPTILLLLSLASGCIDAVEVDDPDPGPAELGPELASGDIASGGAAPAPCTKEQACSSAPVCEPVLGPAPSGRWVCPDTGWAICEALGETCSPTPCVAEAECFKEPTCVAGPDGKGVWACGEDGLPICEVVGHQCEYDMP